MQADGGHGQAGDIFVFSCQHLFLFDDFYSQKPVIAGLGIPETFIAQILLEAGHIMVKGRQQRCAGKREGRSFGLDDIPGIRQNPHCVALLEEHG